MHFPGKTIKRTVVVSNTTLRVYGDKCPKDVELLDMKNELARKYLTKVPLLGASSRSKTVKEGYLSSRTFEVITIKSCVRDVQVDLFFDTMSVNAEYPAWQKCIEDAIDSNITQLTPLMLAKQQIGQGLKATQLRKQKSKSEPFLSTNVTMRQQSSYDTSCKRSSS